MPTGVTVQNIGVTSRCSNRGCYACCSWREDVVYSSISMRMRGQTGLRCKHVGSLDGSNRSPTNGEVNEDIGKLGRLGC